MTLRLSAERLLGLLPCGICSTSGPHLFRIQAVFGFTAVCADCLRAEVRQHTPQDVGQLLHSSHSHR